MAYIAFLSMFALDVFGEGFGFWRTLVALAIHLSPSFVLLGFLALAWRRDWLGALLFAAAGMSFVFLVLSRHILTATKLIWMLTIPGPVWVVAVLFLANWRKRKKAGDVHDVQPKAGTI